MTAPTIDLLFRPFAFGATTLRNRIVMAPMTRRRSPEGVPGPDVAPYYRRRAEGGVGLIISEGTYIDHPAASAYPNVPNFFGAASLAGWSQVLAAVRQAGAKMIPQLWHVGAIRQCGMEPDATVPGYGPCAQIADGTTLVKAITEADMDDIAQSYGRGARTAQDLGFDGVAVHAAHGYLIDQFFWDVTNRRADGHAGSIENRCRFAVQVIRTIRRAVGPGFPIVFRFSQWKMNDYDARIANTPEELGIILRALAKAGADIFDVSARRFWLPAFAGSDLSLAAWARRLSGKPVIAVGSVGLDQPHQSKVYRRPDNVDAKVTDIGTVIERMSQGDFDLVAVARAILADSQWVEKIRRDAFGEIKPFTHAAMMAYE
ncbi:MAG: NADH:flavin oxidoreductase [Alphaproteobacteria bacterium]|nr:NADH:flavin oxidoreductase [Alphaproteobacteria bacterium]